MVILNKSSKSSSTSLSSSSLLSSSSPNKLQLKEEEEEQKLQLKQKLNLLQSSTAAPASKNTTLTTTTTSETTTTNLVKKNSFTDRANKLIKKFELLNHKLENNKNQTNNNLDSSLNSNLEYQQEIGVNNNNTNSNNLNREDELTEEDKTFINSLLLPSQYIDLSLFFYSPNQNYSNKFNQINTNKYHFENDEEFIRLNLLAGDSLTNSTSNSLTNSIQTQNNINNNNNNSTNIHNTINSLKEALLQTSTDSSILTSSTLSNTSTNTTSSFSNSSSLLNYSDTGIMMSAVSPNTFNHHQHQQQQQQPFQFGSNNSSSDEHEELIAEMEIIERLPTQERLKQAKRRRALQLKKWNEYENQLEIQQRGSTSRKKRQQFEQQLESQLQQQQQSKQSRSIKFQHHIVLLDAIMRKDYDEVERLLKSGVTANSANEDGLTAIHQCCIDDSADLLKLLIKYGADVNVCDNDLWTPLHAAATCANLEICKILIENNADLLAVNTDGNMPYDICEDEVCLEYIESEMASRGVTQQTIDLKRSESEFKMLDDLKRLCLDQIYNYINKSGNKNLLNFNLNSTNSTNDLANNFFSYFVDPITKDGKLDLNAKDHNGATLLHIACANGYNSVIEFLLIECSKAVENGLPLNLPSLLIKDNDGWTPLHVATFWGHQRAIEILLENGADINLKTNNDETVLELCDDPDVRDFIIQKSKEIETEQQKQAAARAAAAMQMKLQMISNSNNSLNNGSIKNGNNSSTRSLKRTSTGVSRSSSVRRSSFREKEKAARKLDTSFKDFLYASETQTDQNSAENDNNQETPTGFFNKQYLTLNEENETEVSFKTDTNDPPINPIVINHKDQFDNINKNGSIALRNNNNNITNNTNINNSNNNNQPDQIKKMTSVVKIINNSNSGLASNKPPAPITQQPPVINIYESTPPPPPSVPQTPLQQQQQQQQQQVPTYTTSKPTNPNYSNKNTNYIDDFNNNQLRLTHDTNTSANNNSTLTTVTQIARIHSNGTYLNSGTTNNIPLASSNYSMSASLVSSGSMPAVTSSVNNTSTLSQNQTNNTSINSKHTASTSSIAIIDVNNSSNNSNFNNNNNNNKKTDQSMSKNPLLDVKSNQNHLNTQVNFKQPSMTTATTLNSNSTNKKQQEDGIKYKFKSDQTIGVKTNTEFGDINIDSASNRKLKCFKCCSVM